MRTVGVIAEYDPFHLGHAYHLQQARQRTQADWVLCVMSGCFTQRGQGALLSPAQRARMALESGADVVLELPVPWAVREAEHFALGGISILHRLGCITHVAFGAETDDLPALSRCAALLEQPSPSLDAAVRERLAQGVSHPAALGGALEALFPGLGLSKPNNVLGLCYLRALLRLHSSIQPVLVPRAGDYHATDWSGGFPSATAVRGAISRGDWLRVSQALPQRSYALLRAAVQRGELFHPQVLDTRAAASASHHRAGGLAPAARMHRGHGKPADLRRADGHKPPGAPCGSQNPPLSLCTALPALRASAAGPARPGSSARTSSPLCAVAGLPPGGPATFALHQGKRLSPAGESR